MHIAVLGPSSESLSIEVEHRSQAAPENSESHVGHEDRNESAEAVSDGHFEDRKIMTYPDLIVHGVTNLPIPYPQRLLLTVIATKSDPVTGL
jgi:hypothetical protein